METSDLKNKLLDQLNSISDQLDETTLSHGFRFINKLEKNGVLKKNLSMTLLDDGNLSFAWKFETPKEAMFNIDFDKNSDTLNYCCYIEGMVNNIYGSVVHFEEIAPYVKRFLGVKD